MDIRWSPNPLRTVVELEEADRTLLWHRTKIELLEGFLTEAHFDLDAEHGRWRQSIGKGRTLEESVQDAIRSLGYDFVVGGEKRGGQTFDEYVSARAGQYAEALRGAHHGDCVCNPCSCVKCHAESLLELDTLEGLGKHEAASMDFPSDRPLAPADLDLAIDKALRYDGADAPDWGKPHVPRWIEEHRAAHRWLVDYRAKHFEGAQR